MLYTHIRSHCVVSFCTFFFWVTFPKSVVHLYAKCHLNQGFFNSKSGHCGACPVWGWGCVLKSLQQSTIPQCTKTKTIEN